MKLYILPPDLRSSFAKPLGTLFPGLPEKSLPLAIDWISQIFPNIFQNPPNLNRLKLICVGDVISKAMIEHSLLHYYVKMCFVDELTQRGEKIAWGDTTYSQLEITNPRGAISSEVFTFIQTHINDSKQYLVKIIGEEDLLVLPAVLESDSTTLVFYGQPPSTDLKYSISAGCVGLQVTPQLQNTLKKLLNKFELK
jgi:uncharacterized protein (UPF0218 family)